MIEVHQTDSQQIGRAPQCFFRLACDGPTRHVAAKLAYIPTIWTKVVVIHVSCLMLQLLLNKDNLLEIVFSQKRMPNRPLTDA